MNEIPTEIRTKLAQLDADLAADTKECEAQCCMRPRFRSAEQLAHWYIVARDNRIAQFEHLTPFRVLEDTVEAECAPLAEEKNLKNILDAQGETVILLL